MARTINFTLVGSFKFADFREQESKRTLHIISFYVFCYVTIRSLFEGSTYY